MYFLPQLIAWFIALAWTVRTAGAIRGLPSVADLLLPEHDLTPAGSPSVTVIVPARNEAADIRATLNALLAQDYPHIHIIAIDDRSTDQTGDLMDQMRGPTLTTLHVETLPPDWLGKTHAMHLAAETATSDYLLFTDADILFAPSAIRRALANAVATRADHLVLAPTTIIRRWDEAALLSFFQIFGLWGVRPWKVADPAARDAIGIGAFNLIRREAYLQLGGFEALRMEIVEDLALARRVKRLGLRQRIAFGQGLVRVHWASGVSGIINVMTKNIFAAVGFHITILLGGCAWLAAFCILPFFAIWSRAFTLPAAITIAAIAIAYRLMSRPSGLSAWNALLAPFAASLFLYALLRSMCITLYRGGVTWRGTFYPLADLRKHASPLFPRPPFKQ